jgi:hypothetical protein
VKPVGVSKFFCLLDVPGSFHSPRDEGHAATKVYERAARVVVFDNLDDDSLSDICGVPSPKETEEMPPSLPSFVPGLFFVLCLHFTTVGSDVCVLQMLPEGCLRRVWMSNWSNSCGA